MELFSSEIYSQLDETPASVAQAGSCLYRIARDKVGGAHLGHQAESRGMIIWPVSV